MSDITISNNSTSQAQALIRFALVAESIAATSKRTEKAALLGEYFTGLFNDDLALAARYFAGYIFPLRDQRTINVGGAALLTAITTVSGTDKSVFQEKLVKVGDQGDVAFELHQNSQERQQSSLTLQDLSDFFTELAQAKGTKRKTSLITDFLKILTPLEVKYTVKLLAGDLRIGLKEGAVEDGLARLFKVPVDKVQWVNMLTGDIGETAILARNGQLESARMRLFHPIKFMLASPVDDLTDVAKQMPSGFAVEDKYDGIRAQIHIAPVIEQAIHGTVVNNRRVAIFSRTLDEITLSFPDLIEPLAVISPESGTGEENGLILDGEIVPIKGEQILPFQELQKRLGRKKVAQEILDTIPVAFIAYDVLYAFGQVLINEPLVNRRKILESLPLATERLRCGIHKRFADISNLA